MKYESTILKRLIDTYGVVGNPRYISEIIKEFIVQGKERFPELFTYQADWLAHIDEFGLNPAYTVSYTGQSIYAPNTLERPVKRAILKGSTKYRDIDTGDILDTFDETKNLELVSVKMPVLKTVGKNLFDGKVVKGYINDNGTISDDQASRAFFQIAHGTDVSPYEPYKSNILTVNEDVTLRGIGEVKDELNCLTGEVTERIKEVVLNGSENWVRRTGGTSYAYFINNFFDYNNVEGITSSFKFIKGGAMSTQTQESICSATTQTALSLFTNKDGLSTVENLKTYLSQNPVTIQYKLEVESTKTVDLTILDQNGQNVKQLMSFNGGTHFNTRSSEGSPLPTVSVSVETDLKETLKMCSLDGNTM